MRLRIGISRPGLPLDARYADALAEAGAEPVHLREPGDADARLAGLAALVIPGGGDFVPAEPPPGVAFDAVPGAQLADESALLARALARGMPVLGICYGMQLLAHVAGGRFVYDLPSERPTAGAHRLPEPAGRHPITLARGSRLARCFGAEAIAVNSAHHQAVAEPGAGLRAVAHAADGVIEAIEGEAPDRFVVGVQWHPERMEPPHRRALFGALLAACHRAKGAL